MRTLFLLITLLQFTFLFGQDTPSDVIIYDIIYFEDGSSRKGEILKFNNWDGIVVFKDLHGITTTYQPEDYDHFDKGRRFRIKDNDSIMINLRHTEGYQIKAGLSFGHFQLNQSFTPDDYYLENHMIYTYDQPILLKVSLGEYISRQHFMGATLELGTYKKTEGLFSFGGRYEYQYDKYRSNFAFYFPIELKYLRAKIDQRYTVADSTLEFTNATYPGNLATNIKISMVGVEIGHGFSYYLTRMNSLNLEIIGFAYATLSQRYPVLPTVALPEDKFAYFGAKINFSYCF